MRRLAANVAERKAARDAARNEFDARLEQIRTDIEARGIAGRIADKAAREAREAIDQAIDIAAESKGVIAGTFALLAIWFFRNPILDWLEEMLARGSETEGSFSDDGE